MADIVQRKIRSRIMSTIRAKNTKIELTVRQALFSLGYRYRLHASTLPGRPDLVLPKHRAAIFVHGCFWHGHNCPLFRFPRTNASFWRRKIRRNRVVDNEAHQALQQQGWRTFTVWECCLRGRKQEHVATVIRHVDRWIRSRSKEGEVRR
jgi:DNA mismatch endonuclease (patch repair protein)